MQTELGAGSYVGRVGVLAATLGVGVAISLGNGAGIAHAEPGSPSADPSSSDEAGDSAPTSNDTTAADEVETDPPQTDPPADEDPAAPDGDDPSSEPDGSTVPQMEVEASGGSNTSTNDAGQNTDDAEQEPDDPPEEEEEPEEPAEQDAVAVDTDDSGPPPEAGSEDADPRASQATTTDAVEPPSTQSTEVSSMLSAPAPAVTAMQPVPYVAPNPLEAMFIEVPRNIVTIATTIAGLFLTPFLAPGPVNPAEPPLLWVVLGWIRHEINRTFFNRSAVVRGQEITLALGSGETSDPISFNAYDGDGDRLIYRVPERGRVGGPLHGTVTVDQATGTFTYTPDAGYTGPDQFTVSVSERPDYLHMHGLLSLLNCPGAHTDRAKIRLNVVASSTPPVANADSFDTLEDTLVAGNVLDNDSASDDGPLSAALVSGAAHGSVNLNADGSFSYTPDADFSGVDSFTYTASDGSMTSGTAVVTVAVTAVNDAPVAVDDAYAVTEGGTLTVPASGVLTNDEDVDGDALGINVVDGPLHGTLVWDVSGSFVYKPDEDFEGTDTFTYTISDGALTSEAAIVTITVTAVPDPTVATDDTATVDEDSVANPIDVLGNDSDPDGSLTIGAVGQAAHGTVTISADGKTVLYTPDENYSGTDTFTYTVTDGTSTATATVSITVTATPDPTTAGDDTATVEEDSDTTTIDVLGNDTDPDGSLTIDAVGQAAHGTVTISADGKAISYTPDENYSGADTFTYTVTDGTSTATATVSITVTAIADPTTANNDTATVDEDSDTTTIDVLGNDSDPDGSLTVNGVGQPAHGTVTIAADGKTILYTPDANYSGADSFTYTVTDGASTATATVSITVTATPDATTAGGDTATVDEDSDTTTIDVLGNDTDPDGTLTIGAVGQAAHGTVTISADGKTISYTPDANYSGPDSFTYTVTDGTSTATATVSITVTAAADPTTANDDTATVDEDSDTTSIDVLGNDSDPDGSLTINGVGQAAHGTVTISADGKTINYTPDENYSGTDSFTYTVTDGTSTATATVSITVTAAPDPTTANNDTAAVDEDSNGNVISVLGNDSDPDGSLTINGVGQAAHGTVTISADGKTINYTPDENYSGADSFTYTVTDGTSTATATVSVTVTAIADPTTAGGDTATVGEDSVGNVISVLGNDSDPDGSLTINGVGQAAHGTVTISADGKTINYTPDENYSGADSFTYTVTDGTSTATATVSVTVTATADPTTAGDDTATVDEDSATTIDVLGNDTDPDGTLTIGAVGQAAHGTVTISADGKTINYTPDANYSGPDSFTYTVTDGTSTATATVSVTVTAAADPTTANNDSVTVDEDSSGNVISVLGNDSDPDGPLTIGAVGQAAHGTVTISTDGKTISYTPDENYSGVDSFTYTVTDGTSTATATVSITVTAATDPTTAGDDSATVDEDSSGNVISVLGNDTDPDGPLTIGAVGQAAHGTVTISADGKTINYTPDENYSGADSFTYTVTDGTSTATATVSVTVTAIADPTTAGDDTATVDEDSDTTTIDVLGNDTDPDGPLTIGAVGQATHGTVTISADGKTISYTPDENYSGADSFTYTVTDGTSTATATVSITVTAAADPTTAGDDSVTVGEDSSGNVISVLGNDSDPDGPLTIGAVGQAAHGTVTISADGKTINYTPDTNYSGADTFTYTVTDGTSTATATVSITVTAIADPTTAGDDTATVDEDSNGNVISVLGNDSDPDGPLTIGAVGQAAHGTVTISADGKTINYTPDENYSGTDTFTYTVTDGTTGATATVTITVNAVNDAPVANGDSYTVAEDGSLNVAATGVLGNDSDVEHGSLTAVLVTGPSNGTLILNPDGSFTYTPNANYNGTDTFTYRASDGTTTGNEATVTITVTSVNDAPVATADSYTVAEDGTLNVSTPGVLSNDSDSVENTTLAAVLVTGPSNGTLTLNPDGSFTYTPNANYNGADTFTYRASDGTDTSNLATVSINVTAVNDAPTATDDSYTVAEDGSLGVSAGAGLLGNDSDTENGSLSTVLVSGPSRGSLSLNADGSFTYTPNANYNGTDTFTYQVSDGTTSGNEATVTITITSVNDAPVATSDSYSTNQGAVLTVNGAGVLTNDSDPVENSSLTAVLVNGPANGTLTLNPNGSFTYTPNANFNGTDTFTYRAFDGATTSNVATVTITVVDNVAPTAATVQTTNGGTNGMIQQGDTISFTFSEPIDPDSIKQGWNGAATNVVVRVYDGNILLGLLGGNDTLQVFDATTGDQLPLGTVDMGRSDYATALLGGALGSHLRYSNSTMVMNGNTVTITLGTYSPSGLLIGQGVANGTGTMVWTPATGPEDLAGNPVSLAPATESGAADIDF